MAQRLRLAFVVPFEIARQYPDFHRQRQGGIGVDNPAANTYFSRVKMATIKGAKMVSAQHFEELHDKATRGAKLSVAERADLEAWYARQDFAEAQTLAIQRDEENPANLQKGIGAALAQLRVVARRVQKTTAENQALRQEIAGLRRQLAQQTTLEPA